MCGNCPPASSMVFHPDAGASSVASMGEEPIKATNNNKSDDDRFTNRSVRSAAVQDDHTSRTCSVNRNERHRHRHQPRHPPSSLPPASRADGSEETLDASSSSPGWKCQATEKQFERHKCPVPRIPMFQVAGFNASRVVRFAEAVRIVADLIDLGYRRASVILDGAVNDIKNLWIATEGSQFHRAKVVNKLIAFYLVSLAISAIEMCFSINGKLFRLLIAGLIPESSTSLSSASVNNNNTRIPIGLTIAAVFMLAIYIAGGTTGFDSPICVD